MVCCWVNHSIFCGGPQLVEDCVWVTGHVKCMTWWVSPVSSGVQRSHCVTEYGQALPGVYGLTERHFLSNPARILRESCLYPEDSQEPCAATGDPVWQILQMKVLSHHQSVGIDTAHLTVVNSMLCIYISIKTFR